MFAAGIAGFSSSGLFNACSNKKSLPNIVYILADDLGYGDVRCLNPESGIPTPNIDSLAKDGMVFTDAHSGSAVCTPTRYGILTGRYAWRSRLQSGVLTGYSPHLIEPSRLTVASLLKKFGYRTAAIGKWHLGMDWATKDGYKYSDAWGETGEHVDYSQTIKNAPTDLGFDYFFGISASLDMTPYVYIENRNVLREPDKIIPASDGYAFYRSGPVAPDFKHERVLPVITQKAVDFIRNHVQNRKSQPFFLYFSLTAPHTPILPTKEFRGKSGIGPYGDFVMQCDGSVGQILNALDELNLSDNTLVIFTSDNGPSPAANFKHLREMGHLSSYIFRGYKADIYEGGHRIPFIARWSGNIPQGSAYEHPVCLTDLMATLAAIVGYELPDDAGEDSVNLLPVLKGGMKTPVREAVVHHSINGSFSIRQGKWKLELCPGSGGWSSPTPKEAREKGLPPVQLYDLSADIGEQKNVQDRFPEIVDRLTKLLKKYAEEGRSTPGKPQKNDVEIKIRKT
ncbi:MAG: arylsulfatase [Calditrichaeota bacterium]|nr:arylsulfatase [Calditrichota bacterium]